MGSENKQRIFAAASGAQFPQSAAQLIGQRVEELQPCTINAIVEDARPQSAVLHPFFQWDDALAAEEFRLGQARHIVTHVVIEIQSQEGRQTRRAFHHVQIPTI